MAVIHEAVVGRVICVLEQAAIRLAAEEPLLSARCDALARVVAQRGAGERRRLADVTLGELVGEGRFVVEVHPNLFDGERHAPHTPEAGL